MGLQKPEFAGLRRRAEVQIARGDLPSKLGMDSLRLLHELQVHEVELELQNEELISANLELESLRAQYQFLFDFAPVGFLWLDLNGQVQGLNERGLEMLHVERSAALSACLVDQFAPDSRAEFAALMSAVLASGEEKSKDNLLLARPRAMPMYVRVQARLQKYSERDPAVVLVAMMDVSALKFAMDDVINSLKR